MCLRKTERKGRVVDDACEFHAAIQYVAAANGVAKRRAILDNGFAATADDRWVGVKAGSFDGDRKRCRWWWCAGVQRARVPAHHGIAAHRTIPAAAMICTPMIVPFDGTSVTVTLFAGAVPSLVTVTANSHCQIGRCPSSRTNVQLFGAALTILSFGLPV